MNTFGANGHAVVIAGGGPTGLLGRRMPDLDLVTAGGPVRVFTLLHDARPVAWETQPTRGSLTC